MTEGRFGVTQVCVNGTVPAVTHRCKQLSCRRVRRPRRTVLCFWLYKRDVGDAVPYNHNLKHLYKLQFKLIKIKAEFAHTFRMGAVGRLFP